MKDIEKCYISSINSLHLKLEKNIEAKPIIATNEVLNLPIKKELLKISVMGHELTHILHLNNTLFKRKIIIESIKIDNGEKVDLKYVYRFNKYIAILYEMLAYYRQIKSPETPLNLVEKILSQKNEINKLIHILDRFKTLLVLKTIKIEGNPELDLINIFSTIIRTLDINNIPYIKIKKFILKLLREKDIPQFKSNNEWEKYFEEKISIQKTFKEILYEYYEYWNKIKEYNDKEKYILAILSEFGVKTPIIFYRVNNLYNPKWRKIDGCLIPRGKGYINQLLTETKKYLPEKRNYIQFLKKIVKINEIMNKCQPQKCFNKTKCILKQKIIKKQII